MNQQQPMDAITAANAANVEAMRSLAFASIKATERLLSLNLGLARASLRLGTDYNRPAAGTDWRLMLSQQTSGLQKGAEEAAEYLRSVYQISAEAQADVNEVLSSRVEDMSDSMSSLLDAMARTAPPGSEKAIGMIKAAFSDTVSACSRIMQPLPPAAANNGGNGSATRRTRKA